jgi:hypothetical protein
MMKKDNLYRILLVILLLPVLGLAGRFGWNVYNISAKRAEIRKDYSTVNSIEYGLLSVDVWRNNIVSIVAEKIDSFSFNPTQKDTLKKEVDMILNSLISKADGMINQKQTNLSGKIRQAAFHMFVNLDKIRAEVPAFSQTIINEITKPGSKRKLKFLVNDKLNELASQTRDSLTMDSVRTMMMTKYNAKDMRSFNAIVVPRCNSLLQEIYTNAYMFLGIIVLFLIIWCLLFRLPALRKPLFVLSVILAIIALVVGISSPMIEIDARIKELNFLILNRYIVFHDQVLFYQSKSILDVVHILIATKNIESVLVGMLILIFSVIFPFSKLLSTEVYLLGGHKWKSNKLVNFFAFKSGKWSMADVMVIAIFMAYVGFKGILDNQLQSMSMKTDTISSIATNKTSLEPGFIIFLSFVLFGLILSVILQKITEKEA